MKNIRKYILAAVLTATAGTMMAQDLNSAYFTQDFKYRHDMNPAYGNDQGYAAIPVLGNLNVKLQGSFGVGDVLFKNPDYGIKKGAKKTTTFLHPDISYDEAMKGFDKDGNSLIFDMDIPIASVGFKALGGYNTVELKERTHFALSVPYSFFDFAKSMSNKDYSFDDLGARGWSYAEIGLGHSRQIFDNLRVGAKLKFLFGLAYADLSMEGVHAKLDNNNQWLIEGKAKGELSMKGGKFKKEEKEYKSQPGKYYNEVTGIDTDNLGLGGFGLGLDLGAIYTFKDCSVEWLDGMKVSASLTDLGFISWSNTMLAESSGDPFVFNSFQMKYEDGSFKNGGDEIKDDLTDFANLEDKGDIGGKTTALAATMRLGLEYPMPFYDKLSAGLLYTHRFDGLYKWSEGRLSANVSPLTWLNGGINLAVTSYCTTMGWVLNIHPTGFNFFVGMDHMVGKTGASSIPLDSNVSFNLGMNIAFGSKKKDSKGDLNTLTF
jgi:hypothetical protein